MGPQGISGERVRVIGVGNEYRSDDAVGLIVARDIERRGFPGVRVLEESGEGAALMERWRGVDAVIVIDAVSSGGKAGTIYRFEAHRESMPAQFFHSSTHAFSVAAAVELGRMLDELPAVTLVYGIEGKQFIAGVGLSPELVKARFEVAERIANDIGTI
ncbi:MAG TPA: hydrogenase maturation protease [Bacteroidota bacterium]|nr:hydrogenase maturation protease [Bacteroidota bacterium]